MIFYVILECWFMGCFSLCDDKLWRIFCRGSEYSSYNIQGIRWDGYNLLHFQHGFQMKPPLLQVQSYFDANQADSGMLHKSSCFLWPRPTDWPNIQIEENQPTASIFTLILLFMKPGAPTSLQQLKEVDPNLHSFLSRLLIRPFTFSFLTS